MRTTPRTAHRRPPDEWTDATSAVPRGALLETWTERSWTDGCQLEELADFQALVVRTVNSLYEVIVLSARTGDVLVRGGRFFPARSAARLAGSSLGGSFLKVHGIYVGFRLELHVGGQAIVTSPIQSISAWKTDEGALH